MSSFTCEDCKVDTSEILEYYMVTDELWESVCPNPNIMLCIGCLETRLGRLLYSADFTDCNVNKGIFGLSNRLAQRIWRTADNQMVLDRF